ncbi:hypothetical protein V8E36_005094 [Tilletia maclaganii]
MKYLNSVLLALALFQSIVVTSSSAQALDSPATQVDHNHQSIQPETEDPIYRRLLHLQERNDEDDSNLRKEEEPFFYGYRRGTEDEAKYVRPPGGAIIQRGTEDEAKYVRPPGGAIIQRDRGEAGDEPGLIAVLEHLDALKAKYERTAAAAAAARTKATAGHKRNDDDGGGDYDGGYHGIIEKRSAVEGRRVRVGGKKMVSVALSPSERFSAWAVTGAGFGTASFPLILDTASSDCIVSSAVYDPTNSRTAVDQDTQFSFPYQNGRTMSGNIWRDTLHIGPLTVRSVAVGVSSTAFLSQAGGVCGLAPDGSSAFNSNFHPFFYSMVSQGLIPAPVFGLALSQQGGEVTFGGVDSRLFKGKVQEVEALDSSNGFWKVAGSFAGVGGQQFVLDSASKLIVVPPALIGQYFDRLKVKTFKRRGVTFGSYPCSTPPQLVFNFGGVEIPVIDAAKSIGKTKDGRCVLPIVGRDMGLAVPTVGKPLFLSAYIAFNTQKPTVGFARRT